MSMQTQTTSDGASVKAIAYDPYDFEIDANPYPVWKWMRDEAPLYRNDRYKFWALTRYEDVAAGLKDWKTYSSSKGTILEMIANNATVPPGMMIFEDPPMRTVHRNIMARLFTPRRMAELEPKILRFCPNALDPFDGTGGFDFIKDLGAQMPMRVIGLLLGVPEEDQEEIRDRIDAALNLKDAKPREGKRAYARCMFDMSRLKQYSDWRRKHPSDDLMTELPKARFVDEKGVERSHFEMELLMYIGLLSGDGLTFHDSLVRGRITAGRRNHPVPGGMIETAENLRREYAFAREEQDALALESHRRAVSACESGRFADEIVPVVVHDRNHGARTITEDEHPRPDLTLEKLAALRPDRARERRSIDRHRGERERTERRGRRMRGLLPRGRGAIRAHAVGDEPVLARRRRAAAHDGHRPRAVDGEGARARAARDEARRCDRAERGVRVAGARVRPLVGLRSVRFRTDERERLRELARSSGRRDRRPGPRDAAAGDAAPRRALRDRDDVHRGRPRTDRGLRAGAWVSNGERSVMSMQIVRANLRRARFLATSAYHAMIKLRDGQKLSPGLFLEVADRLPVPRERVLVWSDDEGRAVFRGALDWDAATEAAPSDAPASTADQSMNDPFVFIYTSGTTGLPKAAPMKNGRFLRGAAVFGHAVMRLRPGDVLCNPGLPLYHSTGLVMGFGTVLSTGATLALRRKFSASQFWDDVSRYGATGFTYIGELRRYLLNTKPHPLETRHRLRFAIGAGLRPDIWERFGIPIVLEFYGATEGNIGIVNIDGVPGMMGRLMPGQVIVRADPHTGEITRDERARCIAAKVGESGILLGQINARASFDGYVDPSRNEAKIVRDAFGDGKDYFNTGDLVQLHPHGYVAFKDRMGDTFRWKGENVSTNEVAEVLNRCAGVTESNVYGVLVPGADGRAGMVALVPGDDFDLTRFRAHVDEHLPSYARPLFVRLQEAIQVTATFEQVKTGLRDDGYDLYKIDRDRVFVYDANARSYMELTTERQASIDSGLSGL